MPRRELLVLVRVHVPKFGQRNKQVLWQIKVNHELLTTLPTPPHNDSRDQDMESDILIL